jgi:hypothetical protein
MNVSGPGLLYGLPTKSSDITKFGPKLVMIIQESRQ